MPLEQLASLRSPQEPTTGRRGLPPALLPVGLLVAFVLVFGLMFGSRLLPAQDVTTAPVVTVRASADAVVTGRE